MIAWRRFPGEPAGWDQLISMASETWGYQSWGWGEFKSGSGWITERWLAEDGGRNVVALAQVFLRRIPGIGFLAWVPGGPALIGGRHSVRAELGDLAHCLHGALVRDHGRCYLRCYFMVPRDGQVAYGLSRFLSRPMVPLGSGFSVQLDLRNEESAWLSGMDAKHRYYVRKSLATEGLTWRYGDDDALLADLAALIASMRKQKELPAAGDSFERLRYMRDHLHGALRVVVGDLHGAAVTGCMIVRCGTQAFYNSAATVGPGRQTGAAYAMLAVLLRHLKQDGVMSLDLGGIAPRSPSASGVDHFKMGFGGRVVEYLGEWEIGDRLTRIAGNAAILFSRT